MTIHLHIRELKDNDGLRRQVEADVRALNRLMTVDSAHVWMQHEREVTPAYQAVAMLAAPGQDIRAAARDHTWRAAWQKVVARLRDQIEQRRSRQTARPKGPPLLPSPADRRAKCQRPRRSSVHDHQGQGIEPCASHKKPN